jgi:hypothetical protein
VITAEINHVGPSPRGSVTAFTVPPRRHNQLAEMSPNPNGATPAITGPTQPGAAESALGTNISIRNMAMSAAGKTITPHFMLKTMNNVKKFRGRI